MTLKDSWSHFIFHICKCLLEFATWGKHDVRALDVFLGEQSLRSGSFAFQGDTECSEAVQGDSVALGKMLGQAVEDFLQHRFHHAVWEKAEMFRHFLYEFLMRNRFVGHTLCVCFLGHRPVGRISHRENVVFYHNDGLFSFVEAGVFPLAASKSTVPLPAFSAFRVAAWAMRLATGLKAARERRFWKSSPGVNTMLTAVMLLSVNFFRSSAPSEPIEIQKLPNSASCTFLPSRSISTQGTRTYRLLHLLPFRE